MNTNKICQNHAGEHLVEHVLVLPEAGDLRRGGVDKAKVDEDLEKVGGVLGRAQHADELHPQHAHLVALGHQAQSHVGKLQNVQHHRVFQQAAPVALNLLFYAHRVTPFSPSGLSVGTAAPPGRSAFSPAGRAAAGGPGSCGRGRGTGASLGTSAPNRPAVPPAGDAFCQ